MSNSKMRVLSAFCSIIAVHGALSMDVQLSIKNDTGDQTFVICTDSLKSDSVVSPVWYEGTKIENGTVIAPGKTQVLYISAPERAIGERSDFLVLKNHRGEFYIHLGRTTANIPYPLPVATSTDDDVEARVIPIQGEVVQSTRGIYRLEHFSNRLQGHVLTLRKNA